MAYRGGFVYVLGTNGRSDERLLAGAAIGDRIGCVGSDEGGGDGADFEVIDDRQWRCGASLDADLDDRGFAGHPIL